MAMHRLLDNSLMEALRRGQAPAQETGSMVGFLQRGLRASIAEVGSFLCRWDDGVLSQHNPVACVL